MHLFLTTKKVLEANSNTHDCKWFSIQLENV
jgi:hypothetical protein